jgi:hypothetical protein
MGLCIRSGSTAMVWKFCLVNYPKNWLNVSEDFCPEQLIISAAAWYFELLLHYIR